MIYKFWRSDRIVHWAQLNLANYTIVKNLNMPPLIPPSKNNPNKTLSAEVLFISPPAPLDADTVIRSASVLVQPHLESAVIVKILTAINHDLSSLTR